MPAMRRVLYAGAAAVIVGWLAWQTGAAIFHRGTAFFLINPQDGKVADESYVNKYFGLTYPLPQGWKAGEVGPAPSQSAYYVLATLIPDSEQNAAILLAAQDMFFTTGERGGVAGSARDFLQAVSNINGMTVDRDVMEVKVASQLLYRVDYSGVGLFRATFRTEIRCHIVSFNLTARDRALRERLAQSFDHLSFAAGRGSPPPCVKDYAEGDNVLHKVRPLAVGPKFIPIPVRIIVGADGSVKHVHVIRATDDQRRNIEAALYQWKFKPYEIDGHRSPVETGLVFEFKGDN
jgi:hypothetical protein